MSRLNLSRAVGLAIAILATPALAQKTPQEVAAEREQWRQVCADPNPDLAAGYLQQALESGDPMARRICLRATLESENEDLRSSALRQVIGSLMLIRFNVTVPEEGGNRYIAPHLQNGLIFHATEGDPVSGRAMWSPLLANVVVDERAIGPANVFGSDIIWTGVAASSGRLHNCNLRASLAQGSQVEGQLVCDGDAPFAVTANLMD
ncbi:hypothetical protein SAMN04487972_11936 [Paracoccus halophilus]|uniref:Uncharacterized protein n=1 Tax=Paracoccus halophilus TaxID=376733 RepID=A0A099F039_9RHOB|nr:hypothetical protein [Paracoccus halophilus]KGJ03618.1 hypothetical protein IT41_13470 [Paracoccus halophilus]SFA58031.1 hypothetical protein SAMN04487972_11936 [Paracoccus halophilus]